MVKTLIADLLAAGWTQKQIGARIGVAQNTISNLHTGARGSRPSAAVVDGLRALHSEVCQQQAILSPAR